MILKILGVVLGCLLISVSKELKYVKIEIG